MDCPACKTANRDDAKFCKNCGHSFRVTAPTVPASQVQENSRDQFIASSDQAEGRDQFTASSTQSDEAHDISLEPTLFLTPERVMKYHYSRWQQESEASNQTTDGVAEDIADLPTIIDASLPESLPLQSEGPQEQDITEMPTVLMAPQVQEEPVAIPPPPPPPDTSDSASAAVSTNSTVEEGDDFPTLPSEYKEIVETGATTEMSSPNGEQQRQANSSENEFPALAIGTTIAGRYEVTQVVSGEGQEHSYQVIDHQGYQHCWNCGYEQNAEGDEFCIDCGAELLNVAYVLHEYSPKGSVGEGGDASVIQGSIVHTFVDQDRTYVVEQPQIIQDSFPNGVSILAATASDAGDVRRADPNEDSTLVLQLQRVHESKASPQGVYIVADGLGGHDNGQLASRTAIGVIAERIVHELLAGPLAAEKAGSAETQPDEESLVKLLQGAVEEANATLCQINQRDKTDMGSTMTGFMVVGDFAFIVNVGDSRTYMVRNQKIYQLTNDHSLVGQLVAGGLIQPDDVYTHPQRSQIFRSLGDKLNVQVDIFKQQLHPGDILLSCSDGLWEMVRNPEIESILNAAPNPQVACTQLIEAANANGGEDNVSAVVVFVS